ncbi:MAG: NAD-dependent epimerase/dehydratase family protein [Candidatus Hodarchaeota archaeon]
MAKLKVLLIGASGTVGREVFTELLNKKQDYEISLFLRNSRKNRKMFKSFRKEISIFWGDIRHYDEVEKAVSDQDIVIHVAAVLPDNSLKNPQLAFDTNVGGTKNVVSAMLKEAKRPSLIYTSSVAVYGDRLKNPIIKVSDPIVENSHDVYTNTKIEAEKLIQNSGLRYCIFRLTYVVATNLLKFRRIMFYMPLKTSLEIIHAKDCGLALVNAIGSNRVWGNAFNLSGGKNCQIMFEDHLNDILEIMGFGRNFLPKFAFAEKDFHCGFFDLMETQKTQELLNFQRYSLDDFYSEVKDWVGIRRYLASLGKPVIRWFILRKSKFYRTTKKS